MNLPPKPTAHDFERRPWWTPAQTRDFILSVPCDTARIRLVKALAEAETTRRKSLPAEYVRCDRCYGYHGQLGNIDGLCESCEAHTAPFRFDQQAHMNRVRRRKKVVCLIAFLAIAASFFLTLFM